MKKKFDPLKYNTDKLGRYHVEVFSESGQKVGEKYITALTRREAYFEAMATFNSHFTWDATRIKNI